MPFAEKDGVRIHYEVETVEILLELIKQSLTSGDDVMTSGFGKFCVKNKKKRKGRSPATGKDLESSTQKGGNIQMV